jgi:23S rRNA (guanosine2251-2'-O)-methyltransferase
MIFEGSISVKAVLLANKRPIEKIVIDKKKHDKDTAFIIAKANEKGIRIEKAERNDIDALCEGTSHGGVILFAGDRRNDDLDQLLRSKFLCLLEGIEDPFNFGYCLRSLLAAGCEGVIVGARNWLDSASTVTKSSSGASEYLPIYVADDLAETIVKIKQSHMILCATRKEAVSIYQYAYDRPLLLAIGGEKRGLSKIVLNNSDQNIYIPYADNFRNSLNASSAVSVIAFEIMRQQQK